LLIANRGEVAIRVARGAAELGFESVAVYSEDDAGALHVRTADRAVALRGSGPGAYLDIDQLIAAAVEHGCTAVHPGYGFLSESAAFARRCTGASLVFVGPAPDVLELFGDKARARAFAAQCDVPVPRGSAGPVSLEQAREFVSGLGPHEAAMIKAVAGGGGRGMRLVASTAEVDEAYARCRSEAKLAFGHDEVYIEAVIPDARHIEVQIAGDGAEVVSFGERECSIQRRHQKLVEIAPSPALDPEVRARLVDAATRMARAAGYRGLGTFEFLVSGETGEFAFIEANPRLQVEHTVTEEVMGVDLVQLQLRVCSGERLRDMGYTQERIGPPRGFAIQARVNMDSAALDAPAGGTRLRVFDPPGGPGIRIDTLGYAGYEPSPNFDSLLAKVVAHHPSDQFPNAVDRLYRALCEFRIEGVPHNLATLQNILRHPVFRAGAATTRFVDEHGDALSAPAGAGHPRLYVEPTAQPVAADAPVSAPPADDAVCVPMRARVLEILVEPGEPVAAGQTVAVVEAMKMEHVISAERAGVVRSVAVRVGDVVPAHAPLLYLDELEDGAEVRLDDAGDATGDGSPRDDLAEALALRRMVLDEARPEAVAKRHALGMRTARENIDDLCDPGSFVEYGAFAVAAMHTTRSEEELRRISPADGFIYGLGTVNGDRFPAERAQCMVASYDYTVFAGTQGYWGHKKHDRMFQLAEAGHLPVVIFAEGGGGRPADSDNIGGVNLANPTFWHFGRLSGKVPLVGIAAGRCFAGNAALLGMCDVAIATRGSTIGMGGPVMIEGAGLGAVKPEDVGPASMHATTGVVDVLVEDEAEAVAQAKKYLSYFQGALTAWECADQARLRDLIPQRRTRAYDIRKVIDVLADTGSVMELRRDFGRAAVTALARIEGRPIGIIANNPGEQAGAIGAEESRKFTRFLRLCSNFGLPVVSLCDTPGIMVGPDAEKTALVRHSTELFIAGAGLRVPLITIVLRKAYGLGAMAMAGGSFHQSSHMSIAWPTAEFGAMGLEGQIRLGYRAKLEAIQDPAERQATFERLVNQLYERGKAVRIAPFLSIDDVIDPAESRRFILAGLAAYAGRD